MQVSRGRILALGTLLLFYLIGMILLSAITLYEPRSISTGNNNRNFEHGSKSRNYEYFGPGLRPAAFRARLHWCTSSGLKYLNPPKYPTALASFPGSGNTWLRYLLQQATGIYTGSVYKDYGLLKNGFPAESITNGSVLVVKTHEWGPGARNAFAKSILLVRAPGPAIQAEFNRQSGGHIGFASPGKYKRTNGKYWQQFVREKLSAWRQTNMDWLHNFTGPMHVVYYESLVNNVADTLRNLLQFLEFPISREMMSCTLERKEGIYRRRKRILNFDPYTIQMKKLIRSEEEKVYRDIYAMTGLEHR